MSFQHGKESALKLIIQRLSSIVVYLIEVIKRKDEQLEAKYRIVDWVEKKGVGYCRVHLVGTSAVNDYTPNEIVADDKFISGFGPLDIRTITNLANFEKYKPKSFIISIGYEEKIVEIKNLGDRKLLAINEKIQDQIEQFSKKDVFNLGRIVGERDGVT
jgi:hypothetical protein